MRQPESKAVINRDRYDAVLLDLDGVITDTGSVHAACWKQMFDEYLQKRAMQRGQHFVPLTSMPTTGAMLMENPATTGFATFSHRAASSSPREALMTHCRPPAPDTYLMAARLLEVEPARAVVIEDALSGVEAGSNGNFGLVIGVARKGNAEELRRHGAHLVVKRNSAHS